MKGFLSPNILYKLFELFTKREWKIEANSEVKKSLYQRYCERLKYLDENEQNLFVELSYNFKIIGISDYLEFFLMSFYCVEYSKLNLVEKIIFTPLSKPYIDNLNGENKVLRPITKSSQFLFSFIDRHDLRWVDYSDKFEFKESIIDIKHHFESGRTLIVLVDDFVGTGTTAINCINSVKAEIQTDREILNSDICIISIAALSEGVKKLKEEMGINVYSDIIQNKGISEYYNGEELTINKQLMIEIEKKLKCPVKYSFGYGKSEALITFGDKTPNNTFPAYWHETSTKIAPFPRYKNFK